MSLEDRHDYLNGFAGAARMIDRMQVQEPPGVAEGVCRAGLRNIIRLKCAFDSWDDGRADGYLSAFGLDEKGA